MFAISVFVTKIRIFIFFVEFIGVFSPNFYQIETRGKGENPLGLELLITLLIFSKKKFFFIVLFIKSNDTVTITGMTIYTCAPSDFFFYNYLTKLYST